MKRALTRIITAVAFAGCFFGGYQLARQQMQETYERDVAEMELQVEMLKEKYSTLAEIISCESGWQHNSVGDNGKAHGIAQFHKGTFEEMAREAGCEGCRITEQADQLRLLAWAYDNDKLSAWSCYGEKK